MNNRKLYFFVILFVFFSNSHAQNKLEDELTYNQIENEIDHLQNDSISLWKLINIYISKAKKNKNNEALVYAYRYASNFSVAPKNIKYADSALVVGLQSNDNKLLANAYLNRGVIFMSNSQYQKSLDDILKANEYAQLVNNKYVIYKSKYLIAQNKIYLGLYKEANDELREIIIFFQNNLSNDELGKDYEMYYLYSLMSIIDTNSKIGKSAENKKFLDQAFTYVKTHNLSQYLPYFTSLQGNYEYGQKNYEEAIKKYTIALKSYNDQWNHISEVFYIGKSYWNSGKQNIAVKYFEKIDQEFNQDNKLEPQFRNAYELLIKYNDSLGNRDKQLEYINKLINLDRSYENNYKYLHTTIHKKYDTQSLIKQKAEIEKSLEMKNWIIKILILITLVIIIYFMIRSYRIRQEYEKRFEELISNTRNNNTPETIAPKTLEKEENIIPEIADIKELPDHLKIPGINPQVIKHVIHELKIFEENLDFLNPQITQRSLSEEFGTNSTYLSKIINKYKGKNFNIYVNDLRLDYILDLLKSDYNQLHKDVKELSQISGFSSAENFSDNFQRKFKIKPSFFIKKMKEKYEEN